jgi:hypothetical protein
MVPVIPSAAASDPTFSHWGGHGIFYCPLAAARTMSLEAENPTSIHAAFYVILQIIEDFAATIKINAS